MALIDHHEAVGGEQLGNVIAPRECLERGDINYAGELGLAKDVGGAEGPVARATVDGYLDSLSRLRLTENSPAWAPHMRSATPLQSSLTRYFTDPSLAVAALVRDPASSWQTSTPPATSSRTS